jgi:hypothetical protein
VQRIADKTHHSAQYVENRLRELAEVGAAGEQPQKAQQQKFSAGATAPQQ